jgi:hypothetical protein
MEEKWGNGEVNNLSKIRREKSKSVFYSARVLLLFLGKVQKNIFEM